MDILSVRQPFLDFNARSGRDLIKSLMLADTSDTLVGQKAFLDRLKSSYILEGEIALGLDREKVFSPGKMTRRRCLPPQSCD